MASNSPHTAQGAPEQDATPDTKASTANAEKYDLSQIVQDRGDMKQRVQTYLDEVLVVLDQLYRQQPPTTPYLTASNGSSTNIKQYTDPLIANFINKTVPDILSKGMNVLCPQDKNPSAALGDLVVAQRTISHTWWANERMVPGRNTKERRAKLAALRGGWATHLGFYDEDDPAAARNQSDVHLTVYDPIDVDWDRDSMGAVRRVIVTKRRLGSELPPALRKEYDPRTELDVYEHWDPVSHGIVVNGQDIIKPLTPHGYVWTDGSPMCPWHIEMHEPGEYIKGGSDIVSSGITPLKTLVGHPVVEDLIPITQHLSYVLTLIRWMATEAALPTKEIKGQFIYDAGRRAYLFDSAQPQDGVTLLNSTNNIPATLSIAQFFRSMGERGGMGDGIATGAMKEGISGTAVQGMTDLVKSKGESLLYTVERGMAGEGEIILAMAASNTNYSVADKHKKVTGALLPTLNAEKSPHYNDPQARALKGSAQITGQVGTQTIPTALHPDARVTPLNFAGVDVVEVTVEPYDQMTREQKHQLGTTFLQMKDDNPYSPEETISTYFDGDDPQGIVKRGLVAKLKKNPDLPLGDLDGLDGLLDEMQGGMDPGKVAGFRQQIAQARETSIETIIATKLQAIASGAQSGAPNAGGGGGAAATSGSGGGQPTPIRPDVPVPPPQMATPVPGMSAGAPPPPQPPPPPQMQPPPQPMQGVM